MSQICNDNTKKSKTIENQLGILGISAREFMQFAGNSAEGLWFKREKERERERERESAAGVKYLSMKTSPKSYHIFPQKVATLLSGSRKGTVGA